MERLQKYIARSGVASRRKAEEMIREGKVKVNGEVITEMGTKISSNDIVEIDNAVLEIKEKRYFVMNKPRGIISSVNDEKGRQTVISVLPPALKNSRLFPVGRLDYDTKGVLLLTNDGEFMNTIIGPQSVLPKEYLVRVEGQITKGDIIKLESGLMIDGYMTRKCKAYIASTDIKNNSSSVGIILREGKYHQVKKMFEAVGFPVKRLTRISFGEITADGLAEGEIRELTPHEIKRLIVQSKQLKNFK
ncbi:MAG TPA: pseudouridine synthase [Bacilli bacterium]|nr:pseudouridine synthase [Bacilli bacterium]